MGYKMNILFLKWTEILRETSGVCSPSPTNHPHLCQNDNKVTNHLMPFIIQYFRIYFASRIDFLVSILQTCLPQYNSSYWIFAFKQSASPLLHFHQFSAHLSSLDKNTIYSTTITTTTTTTTITTISTSASATASAAATRSSDDNNDNNYNVIQKTHTSLVGEAWCTLCGKTPEKSGSHLVWVRCAGTEQVPCSGNHRGLWPVLHDVQAY